MSLETLGYLQWQERGGQAAVSEAGLTEGCAPARVVAVDRGSCMVHDGAGAIPAEPSGRLTHFADSACDLPCVGDWVGIRLHSGGRAAVVEQVLPRVSFLRRRLAGARAGVQMIAANVDVAFIVQACGYDFNLNRLERALVLAAEGGVEPVALLAKADLAEPAELARMLAAMERITGGPAIPFSSVTGEGLDAVRGRIGPGRTCCLLGSSGVGKTTLINRLAGRELFRTGAVSATGEGTHTTTRRQLLALEDGGLLIDTPGMREFGLTGEDAGMAAAFDGFTQLAAKCRFADCTHLSEPGCAVLAAMQSGELSAERYDHYRKLRRESEHVALSTMDRRRKERCFSRHLKASKKIMGE